MSDEERIQEIEEEIKSTKYNKATQHHIGKLKAKLARLKVRTAKKGGGAKGLGYSIRKTGDATVAIVGFPSVGKSTLLNKLTNAKSEVGAYEFTTLDVIPGVMKFKGATFQLLDIPGLIKGAAEGKGRGREVIAVVRGSDLVLLMVDSQKPEQLETMLGELHAANIRLNQKPPHIRLKKRDRGGIVISSTKKQTVSRQTILAILNEFRISNAELMLRSKITEEDLIDSLAHNRTYLPAIVVVSKSDLERPPIKNALFISSETGEGVEELRSLIFKKLEFIRIYMKPQGKKPDFEKPLIMKKGTTIRKVCDTLHRDLCEEFRYALISGPSSKFEGQQVGLTHKLKDEDILTLVT